MPKSRVKIGDASIDQSTIGRSKKDKTEKSLDSKLKAKNKRAVTAVAAERIEKVSSNGKPAKPKKKPPGENKQKAKSRVTTPVRPKRAKRAKRSRAEEESFRDHIRQLIDNQPYFFHKIQLWEGLTTPGWSDPKVEKLPYYGMPERLDGMRVLDVGCAEGFFSFEAERRGASEVIAVDSFPDSIDRFNIVKTAIGSNVRAFLCNVYDLTPRRYGTFDLVLFYGVLYHLKNPWLALEQIAGVCSGTLLLQTHVTDDPQYRDLSLSWFHPFGIESGPPENRMHDPTVFWIPTPECTRNLVRATGMRDVRDVTNEPGKPFVMRASARKISKGKAPNQMTAPWC